MQNISNVNELHAPWKFSWLQIKTKNNENINKL